MQKKKHTDEYLRTIAHLRPRTNKYGAAFRIRSEAAFGLHEYFRKEGFYYDFDVEKPFTEEDREKRKNGERIVIPQLTTEEKQDFINQYVSLLERRPDLDSSDSSKLFRGIGLNLDYSNNNGNYTWQEDPTGAMNDRIFPVIDLQKSGYTKTYYNKAGQR